MRSRYSLCESVCFLTLSGIPPGTMGNWGRRSLGCYLCRARRIKVRITISYRRGANSISWLQCDEAKPACNQCVKTRRTCPGYREIKSPTGPKVDPDRKPNIIDRGRNTTSPPRVMSNVASPISVDVEQQALCFFLSNFVTPTGGHNRTGRLDFVVPMLSSG